MNTARCRHSVVIIVYAQNIVGTLHVMHVEKYITCTARWDTGSAEQFQKESGRVFLFVCLVLFRCLFIWKAEISKEREREKGGKIAANGCNDESWAIQKAWSSTWVFHVGVRGPRASTILYRLPRHVSRSWIGSGVLRFQLFTGDVSTRVVTEPAVPGWKRGLWLSCVPSSWS